MAGGIEKIKNRFYFRIKINGKTTRKSLNATNKEDALKEIERFKRVANARSIEEFTANIATQRRIIKENESPLIQEIWELFEKSNLRPRCGEQHLRSHKSAWGKFAKSLPPYINSINDITEKHANAYFSEKKFKPSAYNNHLRSLKLIYKTIAWENVNIFARIKFNQVVHKSKEFFTNDQIEKIYEAVDKTYPLSIHYRQEMSKLFRIAVYTGLRLKCCCMLHWDDVKSDDTLHVIPHKTMRYNRMVTIPIHPELKKILSEQGNGYVLPHIAEIYKRNPVIIDLRACNIIWFAIGDQELKIHPYNKKIGLPKRNKSYGFHSFRHTFISMCANAGIPLDVVKDIVGHTSTSVTRIYTHFTDDTRRKVLLALPGERKTQPNMTQNKVNESSSEELKRQLADSLGIDLDKLSKIIELMK